VITMTEDLLPSESAVRPSRRKVAVGRVLLWILAGLLAVLAGAAISLVLAYDSDVVLPGVESLGVDLSSLYRAHAAQALQDAWEQQRIQVAAGKQTSLHSPSELGLLFDAGATAQAAYDRSRTIENALNWLRRRPRLAVEPVWSVNAGVAGRYLQARAAELRRTPVDAAIRLVDGKFEASPSEPGQMLDAGASLAALQSQATTILAQGRWDLQVTAVPAQVIDLSAEAAEANRFLDHDIVFDLYDPISDESETLTVAQEIWTAWVDLKVDERTHTLAWELNEEKTRSGLQEQVAALGADRTLRAEEALPALEEAISSGSWALKQRIYHGERQHEVLAGETLASIGVDYGMPYPWIERANPDLGAVLYAGQVITIPSPDVLLPLPIVAGKHITISLSSQLLRAYEGGQVKWEWPVSTGMAPTPTAPGVFQVQAHEPEAYAANWDLWMPHFLAVYQPVPDSDFMNGIHGFPWRGANQLLWTNQLGKPATYGCIMISTENAMALYEWADDGTVVVIHE
jgi:lipoprotein-anchoring transpeptidase ErfK/SrfK